MNLLDVQDIDGGRLWNKPKIKELEQDGDWLLEVDQQDVPQIGSFRTFGH